MKRTIIVMIAMIVATQISYGQNMKEDKNDNKILIILAHPHMENSHANKAMTEAVKEIKGVEIVNIYKEPFKTDYFRPKVKATSTIVLEFPFWWVSAPSRLKDWFDEIYSQFNQEGILKGKTLTVALSAGGSEKDYSHEGRNKYTIEELLRPYELSAIVAGMNWHAPFALYSAYDGDSIARGASQYKQWIEDLLNE